MNSSTVLPGVVSSASTAALDARLQQLVSTDVTPGVEEKSASIVSQLTTVITDTLGNDTLNLNSSYSPGNWSSPVNGTSIPTEDEDMAIKRLVVILTNIFVVVAILVTCVLAFRHRKWENMMRSEQQKDPICNYDVVKIEEEEDEEIGEDYEIFEK